MHVFNKIRDATPLIHNLTNQVVMQFTANGLLSVGAIPMMSKEVTEVEEMGQIADAVLINIGTLLASEVEALLVAAKHANKCGTPIVLDPVGVANTRFRSSTATRLLSEIQWTAIKGNAGEMAHLVGMRIDTKGPDSKEVDQTIAEDIARKVSILYNTIAIVTGKTDVVCFNNRLYKNHTGHVILTKITGAGCLLGSIIAAGLTLDGDPVENCAEILRLYGSAAESAMESSYVKGTGTFKMHFIDELGR